MSNAVYPTLVGLVFGNKRTPVWSTTIHTAQSGKELRAAAWSYPVYDYELIYEVLRSDPAIAELQTLIGFYNARQGSFDSFLYSDPSDNSVTGQVIGTGNGVTTAFQLLRAYGGYVEPVTAVNGAPVVRVAGVVKAAGADYTVGSTGILTFTAPPASSAVITADFSFYFRCRFVEDSLEFTQTMSGIWEAASVKFRTIK
jgi:uncharacterized protein (TIGR02217 family)